MAVPTSSLQSEARRHIERWLRQRGGYTEAEIAQEVRRHELQQTQEWVMCEILAASQLA